MFIFSGIQGIQRTEKKKSSEFHYFQKIFTLSKNRKFYLPSKSELIMHSDGYILLTEFLFWTSHIKEVKKMYVKLLMK